LSDDVKVFESKIGLESLMPPPKADKKNTASPPRRRPPPSGENVRCGVRRTEPTLRPAGSLKTPARQLRIPLF